LITGSNSYTGFFTGSQAFDTGRLGVQRVGFYAMVGQAATTYLTSGGVPIPGSGVGNKSFSREGFVGQFYFGPHFDLTVVTQHGSDNIYFGQGYGNASDPNNGTAFSDLPNNTPGTVLPPTARAPSWNGATFEAHYVYSPQLIFIGRYEVERMSQQALTTNASDLGDLESFTIGYRYMPIMTSRAGFAWHNEYNWMKTDGTGPNPGENLSASELLLGFDFAF
jgi:hypothetical protein